MYRNFRVKGCAQNMSAKSHGVLTTFYAYYLILKLSITASLYCSKVYIGMYIPGCMISDNNCFYYNQ